MPEPAPVEQARRPADRYRADALAGLRAGDWRACYETGKGWVAHGGGAATPEASLLHAASGVLLGRPRRAVHATDLGLRTWVQAEPDRAVLRWARGALVLHRLQDPRTALLDLEHDVPPWLVDRRDADLPGVG